MNIPELRFPEFTDEWRVKKFYELIDKVLDFRGRTPLKLGMDWGGNIPSLSALNVRMGYIDTTIDPHFGSEELYRKWMNKGDLEKNDILFTMEAPLGNVALVPDDTKYILSQRVVAFKTRKSTDNIFLYHLMRTDKFQSGIDNLATGSTAKGINQRSLQKILVTIPRGAEQQKIADFLTKVDEKIASVDKKVELLKQYKKGVMQKIFTQQIRFKDEDGQDYPEWDEKLLSEVTERITKRNKDDTIKNVLTNSAVQGIVSQNDFFEKNIANQNNLANYYIVSSDDFVYNPRISAHAPVGPIKRNHLSIGVMSPLYSVFRFKKGVLDFYEKYFETKYWHDYMKSVANSGARHDRMNITNTDLYDLPLPFPRIDEQQKIANFLSAIDDKIKAEEIKRTSAKKFKKALLQRMFV